MTVFNKNSKNVVIKQPFSGRQRNHQKTADSHAKKFLKAKLFGSRCQSYEIITVRGYLQCATAVQ